MEISVILGHPDRGSFNHAIAQTACRALEFAGHAVCFHDLYAEGFDPLLPAADWIPRLHCRRIWSATARSCSAPLA